MRRNILECTSLNTGEKVYINLNMVTAFQPQDGGVCFWFTAGLEDYVKVTESIEYVLSKLNNLI